MTLQTVLQKTSAYLSDKGFSNSRFESELLLGFGLGLKRIDLYLQFDRILSENELSLLRALVQRRSSGEPLAYITESTEFYGRRFYVNPSTLVPRPETETLVEKILQTARSKAAGTLLDLGCGSGVIGLSLLSELPGWKGICVELSQPALDVARQNSSRLGLSERVEFVCADAENFLSHQRQKFDLVVANPPYIEPGDPNLEESVRRFEPELALYAEDQGFSLVRSWMLGALQVLHSDGIIGFEFGSSQKNRCEDFFKEQGISHFEFYRDLWQHDRGVILHGKNSN